MAGQRQDQGHSQEPRSIRIRTRSISFEPPARRCRSSSSTSWPCIRSTHQLRADLDSRTRGANWSRRLTHTMFQHIVDGQRPAATPPASPSAPGPPGGAAAGPHGLRHRSAQPPGAVGAEPGRRTTASPVPTPLTQITVDPTRRAASSSFYPDGWTQRLGQTGPLDGIVHLSADPRRPARRSTRSPAGPCGRGSDVGRAGNLFGDDDTSTSWISERQRPDGTPRAFAPPTATRKGARTSRPSTTAACAFRPASCSVRDGQLADTCGCTTARRQGRLERDSPAGSHRCSTRRTPTWPAWSSPTAGPRWSTCARRRRC